MPTLNAETRESILKSLRTPSEFAQGRELPRIGFYPFDDQGIMEELLMEGSYDGCSANTLEIEPMLDSLSSVLTDLKAQRITLPVARALWRQRAGELLRYLPIDKPGLLDFDRAWDSSTGDEQSRHRYADGSWYEEITQLLGEIDDGNGWVYIDSRSFWRIVSSMPCGSDIADIAAVVARVDPDSLIMVQEYEGIYVYCSPYVELCGDFDASATRYGNKDVVGNGASAGRGDRPTYVLPPAFLNDLMETARAAGLVK